MNDEQIMEVMRLVANVVMANSLFVTEQVTDTTLTCQAHAELEAYLRTIGEPENTFPLNPNGASKWANLQKHDGAEAIGVVFRTGSGSVGSLVDGRVVWADWLAHPNGSKPESVNAELLEALKAILADGLHCDVVPHLHRRAAEAIARAESAIETPAKVSPCAGHAAQLDADETTKRSSGLFKCWICLDMGFIPKAAVLPEPLDVKCPNGCKPKKGGA